MAGDPQTPAAGVLAAGETFNGRYLLEKLVGRGGMGSVWLARDLSLEQPVALKFLPDALLRDKAALDELKRETRRNLELTHPHIVRIYDFVQSPTCAAIAMEFVAGASLAHRKMDQRDAIFPMEEVRRWARQLIPALVYAHEAGNMVHRDLKPANLLIAPQGDVKITDFGLARGLQESSTASTLGTPAYISPEQLLGEKPAVSDDIYSLGATLYELLTGKPPFHSGNIVLQVQYKVPPSMTARRAEFGVNEADAIPAEWERAIASCLAKTPEERPRSMRELLVQLEGAEAAASLLPERQRPASAAPTPPSPLTPPRSAAGDGGDSIRPRVSDPVPAPCDGGDDSPAPQTPLNEPRAEPVAQPIETIHVSAPAAASVNASTAATAAVSSPVMATPVPPTVVVVPPPPPPARPAPSITVPAEPTAAETPAVVVAETVASEIIAPAAVVPIAADSPIAPVAPSAPASAVVVAPPTVPEAATLVAPAPIASAPTAATPKASLRYSAGGENRSGSSKGSMRAIAATVAFLGLAAAGYYFGWQQPEQRRQEQLAAERALAEQRLREEQRVAEEQRLALEAQRAEELRIAEEKLREQAARDLAERELLAEQVRLAEEERLKAQEEARRLALEVARRRAEEAANARGAVLVSSTPAGAEVLVGTISYGVTPLAVRDLRVGSQEVTLRLDGFKEWKGAVEVKANEIAEMSAKLEEDTFASAQLDRQPIPTHRVAPEYSTELRKAEITGEVVVEFIVDTTGKVIAAYVLTSANPALDAPAIAAVKQWRFEPGLRNGRPVNSKMQLPLVFNLDR